MKIAVVYTGYTAEMIGIVEGELRLATLLEEPLEIRMYADPTIIGETVAHGHVTHAAAQRLVKMYLDAVTAGAELVFNICSSIGDVADAAQGVFQMMGVPLIRVDEEMAVNAIKTGQRIGVLATLRTTLEPTKRLVQRCAEAMGKEIVLVDALADGAFGKSGDDLVQALVEAASHIADQVDVIVLAQVSMSTSEEKLAQATGKVVLSSPKFGAQAVARAIKKLKEAR